MLLESVHEDIREFYLDDDFTKTEFQAEFGGTEDSDCHWTQSSW